MRTTVAPAMSVTSSSVPCAARTSSRIGSGTADAARATPPASSSRPSSARWALRCGTSAAAPSDRVAGDPEQQRRETRLRLGAEHPRRVGGVGGGLRRRPDHEQGHPQPAGAGEHEACGGRQQEDVDRRVGQRGRAGGRGEVGRLRRVGGQHPEQDAQPHGEDDGVQDHDDVAAPPHPGEPDERHDADAVPAEQQDVGAAGPVGRRAGRPAAAAPTRPSRRRSSRGAAASRCQTRGRGGGATRVATTIVTAATSAESASPAPVTAFPAGSATRTAQSACAAPNAVTWRRPIPGRGVVVMRRPS